MFKIIYFKNIGIRVFFLSSKLSLNHNGHPYIFTSSKYNKHNIISDRLVLHMNRFVHIKTVEGKKKSNSFLLLFLFSLERKVLRASKALRAIMKQLKQKPIKNV